MQECFRFVSWSLKWCFMTMVLSCLYGCPQDSNLNLLMSLKLRQTIWRFSSVELTTAVLVSALDICHFSEFKAQAIHFKGLPELCRKFPSPPCALLRSYHCCWLEPRHQPTLSEAFSSGTLTCSKRNYIIAVFVEKKKPILKGRV